MKLTLYLLLIFQSLTPILLGAEEKIEITYETISAQEVVNSQKYKILDAHEPGHHKTVLRIKGLSNSDKVLIKWNRPVFEDVKEEQELSLKQLLSNASVIQEKEPVYFISSRGFLPGEKIYLTVESTDGKLQSPPIRFQPQPVIIENPEANIKISAELMTPILYAITLEGFQFGEKIRFSAFSCGEKTEMDVPMTDLTTIMYSPAVKGQKGRISAVSIEGENGKKITFSLPWAEGLLGHLHGEEPPLVTHFATLKNKGPVPDNAKIAYPMQMAIPDNIDLALDLPEVQTYSKKYFDPFLTLRTDRESIDKFISLEKRTPPLRSKLTLERKFLFIDGDKDSHYDWTKTHDLNEYSIVVVRGGDLPNVRKFTKGDPGVLCRVPTPIGDVYFDLFGVLFQKVGVKKLPSRVSQQGNRIMIEEVPVTDSTSLQAVE